MFPTFAQNGPGFQLLLITVCGPDHLLRVYLGSSGIECLPCQVSSRDRCFSFPAPGKRRKSQPGNSSGGSNAALWKHPLQSLAYTGSGWDWENVHCFLILWVSRLTYPLFVHPFSRIVPPISTRASFVPPKPSLCLSDSKNET